MATAQYTLTTARYTLATAENTLATAKILMRRFHDSFAFAYLPDTGEFAAKEKAESF
jgi:hypothetical protein